MTKYIKTKDGKFAGSIGEGKNKTPRFGPYLPDYSAQELERQKPQPIPAVPEKYAKQVEVLNAGLEEIHINSYGSDANHAAAVADARSRGDVAAEEGRVHEARMWVSMAELLEKSKEGNWKPETTYLGVHWMQLITPNVVHHDSAEK